jgi:hypothetical protein
VLDGPGLTVRKVARQDPRKLVRGVRAAATGIRPGLRLRPLDRLWPPVALDRECRPYEFGWMLDCWLGDVRPAGMRPSGVLPSGVIPIGVPPTARRPADAETTDDTIDGVEG